MLTNANIYRVLEAGYMLSTDKNILCTGQREYSTLDLAKDKF